MTKKKVVEIEHPVVDVPLEELPDFEFYADTLYFDIETGKSGDWESFKPSEFSAPKNLKDPEKIKKAEEEAEQKFLEKCALSPITGRVILIGMNNENDHICLLEGEEHLILAEFWDNYKKTIEHGGFVIGWNIHKFDLPFLCQRSWKHRIKPCYGIQDKYNKQIIDLSILFSPSMSNYDNFISLQTASEYLGIGTKSQQGKNFEELYNSNKEAAYSYLKQDLKLIKRIGNIVL